MSSANPRTPSLPSKRYNSAVRASSLTAINQNDLVKVKESQFESKIKKLERENRKIEAEILEVNA